MLFWLITGRILTRNRLVSPHGPSSLPSPLNTSLLGLRSRLQMAVSQWPCSDEDQWRKKSFWGQWFTPEQLSSVLGQYPPGQYTPDNIPPDKIPLDNIPPYDISSKTCVSKKKLKIKNNSIVLNYPKTCFSKKKLKTIPVF